MSSAIYYSNPPRCLVTFDGLNAATATLTIYRTSDGRTEAVRGGTDLAVGTPFAMDYEIPTGVQSSYRAQMFDSAGTDLGYTSQVTQDVAASEGTWLQQPLAPETAMRVRVAIVSGDKIRRPTPADTTWAEGAVYGRVIGGQRRGITGASIRIFADDVTALGKIDAMLGGYGQDYPSVLLLRTPPPLRLPRAFFMGVTDPTEFRFGMYALSGFDLPTDEVEPPYPGLVRAQLRRKDIDAAYSTRAARAAAYATRVARDQDYSKAGLGG